MRARRRSHDAVTIERLQPLAGSMRVECTAPDAFSGLSGLPDLAECMLRAVYPPAADRGPAGTRIPVVSSTDLPPFYVLESAGSSLSL